MEAEAPVLQGSDRRAEGATCRDRLPARVVARR
ncbi:hypothetical protein Ae168Ps1_3397c [Pseudonocardia sp. Ae168_Ps1]|nr:hypothetical protein Ae150APs1_3376c [Pseudonocardia sp. Ae150A_Ps1]OLL80991.1 hypothetical protein Ae168Ps1_3397c [Pseudonocardia sp. Ae168_Ps1]OLL84893.1 hypothetical protein Ae263Ps1_1948 [Pseudonocardia sp. Ae263_Ps1]OLL95090.1 hypothetical protein Ae356Ps1_4987c [Pseudonocardia sp. Ae356_Ps1]